jgi:hypothetical protein
MQDGFFPLPITGSHDDRCERAARAGAAISTSAYRPISSSLPACAMDPVTTISHAPATPCRMEA